MIDAKDLQQVQDIRQMAQSAAWREFREMVTEWVAQAYEGMMDAKFASDQVRSSRLRQYEERVGLMRHIDQWTESANKSFEEITESMRQDLERISA